MEITASTLLLKVDTNEYPVFFQQVRQANPRVSFPETPSEDTVADFGYAVVTPTPRPTGDVITEGLPVLTEGVYHQTWEVRAYTQEELDQRLSTQKTRLFQDLLNIRETDLSEGFLYTTADQRIFGVQLRPEDRVNLLGLRLEAAWLIANAPEELTTFRSTENVNYTLTGQELMDMCNAALAAFKQVYAASWTLRDQIDNATTVEELPVLPTTLVV